MAGTHKTKSKKNENLGMMICHEGSRFSNS